MKNKDFWKNRELLASVTTIMGKWKDKIKEADSLGIKRLAIFFTALNEGEETKLLDEVDKSSIIEIPFVHLKSTTSPEVIYYLRNKYNLKKANIHTVRDYPKYNSFKRFSDFIFIENTSPPMDKNEISQYAGVCLDFSHLENNNKFNKEKYEHNCKVLDNSTIGCNHISAFRGKKFDLKTPIEKTDHYFTKLSQFDYLKNFPEKYFSDTLAMEVENSITEQLKAITYIKKLLS